ncbi:hypothetical protein [Chryseobacterium viscerum]|jgi:hypothetical protein|uniref:hypothetical protein n=1 Tax=Chryseobacterium TaxID=59732 RepID=UPI00068B8E49|nr:hypothetical protein [Chryseobacterium viscerum]MCW1962911.1 hypothetical protein [Chryseobacterium viscerum]WPO89706.1 hypothetical protein SFA27_15860 [Chryseobacterium sp. HR92]
MKIKLSFFLLVLVFVKAFSQNTETGKSKMDFYFNPSLNAGFNINKKNQTNNSQYIESRSSLGNLTYSITAIGGYNFLPNFAIGTGFKYSFIQDNYHLIYWIIQPKIIFSPGERPFYIDINYGKQLNHSAISETEFWGGRLGMQVSYSKRLSQEGGIVFESHKLKDDADGFFIGLSYGITIFSNKNYTGYGKD